MKQFNEAFDELRGVLKDIDSLVTEAGGEFNETQEDRAEDLLHAFMEKGGSAVQKAHAVINSLETAREQRQAESDARQPITDHPEPLIPADVQLRIDKITSDAMISLEDSVKQHADAVKTTGGSAGGVQTAATGNVVDNYVHGDSIELASSEGAISVHETGDGSRVIAEEGEGLKTLTADQPKGDGLTDAERIAAEVFPEGSSRDEGWDRGFAGDDDRYGIVDEYLSQSFSPDAAKPANTFTGSITADAPADAAAHIAGQEEVIRESHPEGDTTAK